MHGSIDSETAPQPRHYIVVVHGIGDQKLNETTTPVVHRFAEVRNNNRSGHYKNLLPSYLSAQSVKQGGKGHGWSEFNGIPVVQPDKGQGERSKFDGTLDSSGQNFRFVDIAWQHILKRHQEHYASPVEQWAPALLARLRYHTPPKWLLPWALPLLNSVATVALQARKALAFKNTDLAKKIFDGFLGDVHLYGDYSRTRSRAVRHFHVILDEIMLRDFIDFCRHDLERIKKEKKNGKDVEPRPYQPPEFTVIAHSLGSIMSFDALVYARARQDVRNTQSAEWKLCPSIPFLGYTYKDEDAEDKSWGYFIGKLKTLREDTKCSTYVKEWNTYAKAEQFPELDTILDETDKTDKTDNRTDNKTDKISAPEIPLLMWRNHVKNFITLGSPIDKYHVMWWQKYLHMGLRRNGFTPELCTAAWT